MANYKTPGVYIEEISKFPPSVAQVETAIPAFIGYTEKAERLNGDTLNMIPTRITSLLEYETYFGRAADETTISVDIDDETDSNGDLISRSIKVHQPSDKQPYLMYYSMQMYFANGGGPCYITSVAEYGANAQVVASGVDPAELISGLAVIEKEDEPTLLVYPDAAGMSSSYSDTDFYSVYNASLAQCLKLQDRFTLIDLRSHENATTPISVFRQRIANEGDLRKYGAAYFPYVDTILDYQYSENSITINHTSTVPRAVPVALINLNEHLDRIDTILPLLFDNTVPASYTGLLVDAIDFVYDYKAAAGLGLAYDSTAVDPDPMFVEPSADLISRSKAFATDKLDPLIEKLAELVELKNKSVNDANSVIASVKDEGNNDEVATQSALDDFILIFEAVGSIEEALKALQDISPVLKKVKKTEDAQDLVVQSIENLEKILEYTFTTGPDLYVTAPNGNALVDVSTQLDLIITNADAVKLLDTDNGSMNGRPLGTIEGLENDVYNKIKLEISALPMTLPPACAMAGVYARIDSTRGVWKAPANVGLSYVVKPSLQISHDEQADMNVTSTGKSVNAIRSFTGKGTLVWGARTLAGNDNEWRYINVRRFFNMVEESVGKATEQFVFEGNDANTWVRVRAMIENFLILQWKAGALAGAKAEQAFYVRVGLGQTMTAQDILEGRMIIEIGMAAVRPAEFIILRFSHKMQEA